MLYLERHTVHRGTGARQDARNTADPLRGGDELNKSRAIAGQGYTARGS